MPLPVFLIGLDTPPLETQLAFLLQQLLLRDPCGLRGGKLVLLGRFEPLAHRLERAHHKEGVEAMRPRVGGGGALGGACQSNTE